MCDLDALRAIRKPVESLRPLAPTPKIYDANKVERILQGTTDSPGARDGVCLKEEPPKFATRLASIHTDFEQESPDIPCECHVFRKGAPAGRSNGLKR